MKVSFHSLQCLCLVSASNKTCTQIADDIGINNPSNMAGFFATIIQQLSLITTSSYAMSGDCSATSCQQCRNRHCFDVHIVKALWKGTSTALKTSSIEVAISGPIPCPGNNIAFIIVLLWIRGEGSLPSMQRCCCCQRFVVGRR